MAVYAEFRGRTTEAEPIGLLTEGAAGIAVIALAVIALAGVSAQSLTSIAAIVIGVGLMVQAFNSAAEAARALPASGADTAAGTAGAPRVQIVEPSGEVLVNCLTGLTGIVLGILALVGTHGEHLLSAALIVFGGSLLLSGAISLRPRPIPQGSLEAQAGFMAAQSLGAASGAEVLIGIAAIVLGILSLVLGTTSVLTLVGFIAVGAALLLVSASFAAAVMRWFT
jgi:hypothetical protein